MTKMNYSKLLGRMKERGYTQKSLAATAGISEGQFSQKIAGAYPFKQTDICRICDSLEISPNEIGDYFFHADVVKTQHEKIGSDTVNP